MRISFYNIGCKVNYAETSSLKDEFEALGFEIVEFGSASDAVIINTCTVTKAADADCRKVIRRAARENPEAFIGVMGCYAQLKPEEIVKIAGVDAIFGSAEKFRIPQLVQDFKKRLTPEVYVDNLDDAEFHGASTRDSESRSRAVLKIQDGCDYSCTYCTIPRARGASRGMDFDAIPAQIEAIENSGFKEIVLTGINLGEYKSPDGHRFKDVVELIASLPTKARFRISSIEANLVTDDIIRIVANSPAFCNHFHIPLQSGSDSVLKMMKRRYNTSQFRALIEKIKNQIPDCGIGLDVITGFPGETDILFQETFDFIESLPVSFLHVFTYSERDGTPAADFPGVVPVGIRKERTFRLRELADKKSETFFLENIGATKIVIAEAFNAKTGLWTGHTDNYIPVKFDAGERDISEPIEVRLVECKGQYISAEII